MTTPAEDFATWVSENHPDICPAPEPPAAEQERSPLPKPNLAQGSSTGPVTAPDPAQAFSGRLHELMNARNAVPAGVTGAAASLDAGWYAI